MIRITHSVRIASLVFAALLSSGSLLLSVADTANAQVASDVGDCKKLSVGGASGWEPITYIDQDGQQVGLGIDILQTYANDHNFPLELHLDIPWTRALQMLEKGELDVIAGAYFTKERNSIYRYSIPFAYDEIMVFQHKNRQFKFSGITDLLDHLGARPQGGSYGDFVDAYARNHLDMIYSPIGNKIFDVLLTERANYVLLGRYDGLTNIYRDKLETEVFAVEPPLVRNDVRLMFSRNSPCLESLPNINLLISEFEKNGTLAQLTTLHLRRLADDKNGGS
jgi:polar amino acid transport system substrate-binding protein